jgi:curved DNA-binding protein CbpA
MAVNYYEILGVGRSATADEIRAAYRRAAKRAHPDQGGSSQAFILVQEALDRLLDDLLKRPLDNRQPPSRYQPSDRTSVEGEDWTTVHDQLQSKWKIRGDPITVFAPQRIGLTPFASATTLNLQAYNWLIRSIGLRGEAWDFHISSAQTRIFFRRAEDATLFKLRFAR